MKNMKKAVALVLCVVLTVSVLSISALAANANVTYSGNAGKFIFAPGSKYSLTDLFPNFKDVMPGDTLRQKITVNNDAKERVKVKIYLRSSGTADESYAEFLDQLHLTVQKAENTPMFDAAADKTGKLTRWTYLGTLYSGGKVDLNVTLEVPTTMDNRFQKDYGEIIWEFAVEELPVSPDDPKPPKTGDESVMGLWMLLLILSAAGIFLLSRGIVRHKKKKRVEF